MANKKQQDAAWAKAKPIRGKNPDTFRRDSQGNKIRHGSYGGTGKYGWEVDHKQPQSKGGSDESANLQALQWEANREKSDKVRRRKP